MRHLHYTVHEAAAKLGVSAQTLRRYERDGIVAPPPRDRNGWRRYDEAHITRIQQVIYPEAAAQ